MHSIQFSCSRVRMNIIWRISFLVFVVGIICSQNTASTRHHGVQIVTLNNHTFELKIDDLKSVLGAREIRDRYVVVISIAGAFREGKSFMMNFFLRYLYAMYKTHDATDWINGDRSGRQLNGFKWRGGYNRETTGIWMWSDVFTHDFANGDKVAIVLLDTQGIFDDQTDMNECTLIFGLSTLLSSIQCYNVMQSVQENHLQNLQLFTEYGRLATSQMNTKPFQELIFLIRDWPNEDEAAFGWSQKVVSDILKEKAEHTYDMFELRSQIKSSFQRIRAFLMPHPGDAVADDQHFRGDIREIDQEFKDMLLQFVPGILAPENLLIKKINGQKVKARELVIYFKAYLDSFNNIGLLDAPSAFNATAQAYYEIQCNDCLKLYNASMCESFDKFDSYLADTELVSIHERCKNESLTQSKSKPQFGGSSIAMEFQVKVESSINSMFDMFKLKNDYKRSLFVAKAKRSNSLLTDKIYEEFTKKMKDQLDLQPTQDLSANSSNSIFVTCKEDALKKFDVGKMGAADVFSSSLDKLKSDLDIYDAKLKQSIEELQRGVNSYSDSMQNTITIVREYYTYPELVTRHETVKNEAVKQFQQSFAQQQDELTLVFQTKLISGIENKFQQFISQNDEKRNKIIKDEEERQRKEEEQRRLNRERDEKLKQEDQKKKEERESNIFDNDIEIEEIISDFEIQELEHLEESKESYINEIELLKVIATKRRDALRELRQKLKGDAELKNISVNKFERKADSMEARIKETNKQKKATFELKQKLAAKNNAPTGFTMPSVTILTIIGVASYLWHHF